METVVGLEGKEELEESGFGKNSSLKTQSKHVADPVVYKLVRVEGDGRLVPATDEEVMEVFDLLEVDESKMQIVTEKRQPVGRISEAFPVGKNQLEVSRLPDSGITEANPEKLSTELENIEKSQKVEEEEICHLRCRSPEDCTYMNANSPSADQCDKLPVLDELLVSEIHLQETASVLKPSSNGGNIDEFSGVRDCLNPTDKPLQTVLSPSAVCTTLKPDFSKLEGEICLDNLSIRELQETFRATFGRETTVKDKLWLKRRIAMGLTNSCDVSATSFTIRDGRFVKKNKEVLSDGSTDIKKSVVEDETHDDQTEDHQIAFDRTLNKRSLQVDHKSEVPNWELPSAKRIRKPTRRYIEELSEVAFKENSGRPTTGSKNLGSGQMLFKYFDKHMKNVPSDGKSTTRLDSFGGFGAQIPRVPRVRRSRPRKNIEILMKVDPIGMAMEHTPVEQTPSVNGSQLDDESRLKISKSDFTSEKTQWLCVSESEKCQNSPVLDAAQIRQYGEGKHITSSEDASHDNNVTVPTAKGGMRRKHHRAWTLSEVLKLVEGVSRYGAGRWSEIKRLAFASYSYRTSVDLKDKWRNLLKASYAQTSSDGGGISRKQAALPIPDSILSRVRELAQMHDQAPSNIKSATSAGNSGNNVSGYL